MDMIQISQRYSGTFPKGGRPKGRPNGGWPRRKRPGGRKKKKIAVADTAPIPQGAAVEDQTSLLPEEETAPVEAAVTDSDNAEGGDQA